MATCTTGSIDIGVDPTALTVADPTGFSIGDTISIDEAVGAGQPLITTITNIVGSVFTILDGASATIVDQAVCIVVPAGNGWFGPQSDCGCTCGGCTCESARDSFADTQIAFSGGAAAATLDSSEDIRRVCYGAASTSTTYSFPGVANDTTAIDTSTCDFTAQDLITGTGIWEGTANGSCYIQGALYLSGLLAFSGYVRGAANVTYGCASSLSQRTVTASATYMVWFEGFEEINLYPPGLSGSWTDNGGGSYTAVVGNVTYIYTITVLYHSGIVTVYLLDLRGSSTVDTTIDLSSAPAVYDPLGFLVGVATLT